jgi:uncharacterized protein YbbC (DUF1343 family)
MGVSFFKNIIFIPILGLFSCGSSAVEKNQEFVQNVILQDTLPFSENKKTIKEENREIRITLQDTLVFGRSIPVKSSKHIFTGANQWQSYMDLLSNKKVGIVANQTAMVNDTLENKQNVRVVDFHLVDFITDFDKNVTKVFAPEHGFRGKADAGEVVKDGIDLKTGIPIISLYGKNKKPTAAQLSDVEIVVFDIQDVGARFYTYISSLHYVMEACAENNIPVIVLDRPNPNGHYTDGPILEPAHTSFVGMHPIPVVHGMTIGEYAQMINGQGWLANKIQCNLRVIKMKNYTHKTAYSLPIKPSPNLPNDVAITLYPSLCFFEGTSISAGRGTKKQFQIFGSPTLPKETYTYGFTPQANEGAKHPKFKGEYCHGLNLSNTKTLNKLNLHWCIEAYTASGKKEEFFNAFFTKLAGTKKLQEQIIQGRSEKEIRATWQQGLDAYNTMRQQYLLYK